MSSAALPEPVTSLDKITRLRYRRRRLRSLDGLLRLAATAAILAWLTFFLDWALDLPIPVRLIHTLVIASLFAMALRIFVLTARRPVTDTWLANQVEAQRPELRQSLITAVELAGQENPRTRRYSPVLLERTVKEAEEAIREVDTAAIVSSRGAVTSGLILTTLVGLGVIGAYLQPGLAQTFVARDLLFRDEAWPRAYLLVVEEPTERTSRIAMGDSLTVLVRKERGGSKRVRMDVEFEDESEQTFTLEKKEEAQAGKNRYRQVFSNVTRDFSFRVLCGDYQSARYRVEVKNRPRIEEIRLTFDYPDYTGLDDAPGATTAESLGGHVKVPIGTVVNYTASTSIPVSEATRVEELNRGGETQTSEETLTIEGDRNIAGSFKAEFQGVYYFRLKSKDDFVNPSPIRYRIAVINDERPALNILKPGRNLEVTRDAEIEVEIEGQDDYLLVESQLLFRNEGEDSTDETIIHSVPLEELTGVVEGATTKLVSLQPLGLSEGARIEYLADAQDASGQTGRSRPYVLTIVAAEELLRILGDELTLIGEAIEQTRDLSRDSRSELESVLENSFEEKQVATSDLPLVRHARLTQERVGRRLGDSEARIDELIDRVLKNHLVWKDLKRIQDIATELKRVNQEAVTAAYDKVQELVKRSSEGETLEAKQVAAAVDLQRQLELELTQIVDLFREWGDLNSVIQKLREAADRQRDLENRVKTQIQERLGTGENR